MGVPNRGPELLAVNIAFMATALLACALRCFVRIRVVRAFGLDDWLMVLATLLFISYCIASIVGIHYGTGRHHRDLSEDNIEMAKHSWYFCYLFYTTSMTCSKLSIGFLLLRISVRRLHSYIIYAAMLASILAGAAFFFVCLLQCYPVSYMWDKRSRPGICVNSDVITALAYIYSVFSIMTDLTFTTIPGFLVWHLQLKQRTKIALIPLITMGCIASVGIIVRIPFLRYLNSPDFLWATLDVAIWSTVEQGLAILAGCLATLRPLFFLALHRLGLTTHSNRPSNYGMSAQFPANAALGHGHQADKPRPGMYELSSTVQTRGNDEAIPRTGEFPKSPNWFHGNFPSVGTKDTKKTANDDDNESERNLRITSSKNSEDDNMHIMVSKSFFITDEERRSIVSRGGAV